MANRNYSLATQMWGPNAPSILSVDVNNLYFEVGGSPSVRPSVGFNAGFYGEIAAAIRLNFLLGFGFIEQLKLDSGAVSVNYAFDPNAKLSGAVETLNQKSYVDTSAYKVTSASISTDGLHLPNTSMWVDLLAKVQASLGIDLSASAGIDLGLFKIGATASVGFGVPLVDAAVRTNVASIAAGGAPIHIDGNYGSLTFNLPTGTAQSSTTLIADATDRLANVSTSHVSDAFSRASVDFAAVAAALAGLSQDAVHGAVHETAGPFFFNLDYTLLSLVLAETASLRQDFTFDAKEVPVTMVSQFGPTYKISGFTETVTGHLGDKLQFETPEGEGTFQVTATYDLKGTLTLNNYLELNTSFEAKLLEAAASAGISFGKIGDLTLGPLHIGPLADLTAGGGPQDTLVNSSSVPYDLGTSTETYTIAWEKFYTGTSANDAFVMTAHQVSVHGEDGNDKLTGNALDNQIWGDSGDDILYGMAGNDTLNGGLGADVLDGGPGIDTASYDGMTVGVLADLQAPTRNTNSARGDTYVSIENLTGTASDDVLWGDGGDNLIIGGAGNDELHGRDGNDTLVGGLGSDTLYGDAGSDVFLYRSPSEGGDRIVGFSNGDHIAFDSAAFGITSLISGTNFFTGKKAVPTTNAPTLLYDNTAQDLYYDADGKGPVAAVLIAHINGQPPGIADFIFV